MHASPTLSMAAWIGAGTLKPGCREGMYIYKRRRLHTLVLGIPESRKFNIPVKSMATSRCPWDVYISFHMFRTSCIIYLYNVCVRGTYERLSISAWGCALLVLLVWAMREPRYAERVTVRFPRFFVYHGFRLFTSIINPVWLETQMTKRAPDDEPARYGNANEVMP